MTRIADAEKPLYRCIADEVRGKIAAGLIADGARLPPAQYWGQSRNVSRVTVRKALDLLLDEGWIERCGTRKFRVRHSGRPAPAVPEAGVDSLQLFFDPGINPGDQLFSNELQLFFSGHAGGVSFTALPTGATFAEFLNAHPRTPVSRVVFIGGYEPDAEDAEALRLRGAYGLVIGRGKPGCPLPQINGAHVQGGWSLARHMLQLGHERLLLVSGMTGHVVHDQVVVGYRQALTEAGLAIDPALIYSTPRLSVEAGATAVAAALDGGVPFTGLIAVDGWVACGVLRELGRRGIRVPEDMAVAVYFRQPWLDEIFGLPITGIEENRLLLVNMAREILGAQAQGREVAREHTAANLTLVVRRSCGAVR